MQWVKLLCEIEFYNIVIFIIFYIAGIQPFSVKAAIKCIIPFYTLGTEFVSSYLVFFGLYHLLIFYSNNWTKTII